ncbi:MAG TPA: DUF6600 domain-containing protein [Myxococcaceae bacterium]|nr:DUF6600 domain-containing protein [Myxococcaceae bacterium]
MMRGTRIAALLCGFALAGCVTTVQPTATVAASNSSVASVEVFYGTLAPYGEWVYVGSYGRVWRPSVAVVGPGFRPYGPGGYWVYTDYGWSFESDWSWGWAPFHYGRWYLDGGYGWVWVPGTVWAPAWVSWRYGGGYVGWAPLPPPGSAIVIETYHPYWCFVETRYLVARDVYHYAMPVQNYHAAFSATVVVQQNAGYGGARWSPGPPVGHVSQAVGHPIHTAGLTPPPAGAVQAHRIGSPPSAAPHPTGGPYPGNPHPGAPAPGGAPHPGAPPSGSPHPSGAAPPTGSPHPSGQSAGPPHDAVEAVGPRPEGAAGAQHAAGKEEAAERKREGEAVERAHSERGAAEPRVTAAPKRPWKKKRR